MDLGIKGKAAIVCVSSKGLGKTCAKPLAGVYAIVSGDTNHTLQPFT